MSLLISYLDGTAFEDSRKSEVVAESDMGGQHKFFVREGNILKAIPEQIVMSRIYTEGAYDFNVPQIVEYIEEHPGEIETVDWSLMEQVWRPN